VVRVSTDDAPTVPRYLVTLDAPAGRGEIEVPTYQGPDAAGRRAFWAACSLGWGDVDEITILSVAEITTPETGRDGPPRRTAAAPEPGAAPAQVTPPAT
jgi:hypothetical protein